MTPYTAHPGHVYVYCLPLLVIGSVLWALPGWWGLGLVLFLAGVGVGLWIVVSGINRSRVEVLDELYEVLKQVNRVHNIDILESLGFELPDKTSRAVIKRQEPEKLSPTTINHEIPVSIAKLKAYCNGVLTGQSLAKEHWSENGTMTTTESGKVHRMMRTQQYSKLKIVGVPHSGYELTAAGIEFCLLYADESVRMQYRERDKVTVSPTLPDLNR